MSYVKGLGDFDTMIERVNLYPGIAKRTDPTGLPGASIAPMEYIDDSPIDAYMAGVMGGNDSMVREMQRRNGLGLVLPPATMMPSDEMTVAARPAPISPEYAPMTSQPITQTGSSTILPRISVEEPSIMPVINPITTIGARSAPLPEFEKQILPDQTVSQRVLSEQEIACKEKGGTFDYRTGQCTPMYKPTGQIPQAAPVAPPTYTTPTPPVAPIPPGLPAENQVPKYTTPMFAPAEEKKFPMWLIALAGGAAFLLMK